MKKLLIGFMCLIALALVGCEPQEEQKTAEEWAVWYVLDGHDTAFVEPYIYTVESAFCDFGEYPNDADFEYYACFVVTVSEDLNMDATERKFAVVVAWEETFWMRALWLTTIPESAIADIDEVEIME